MAEAQNDAYSSALIPPIRNVRYYFLKKIWQVRLFCELLLSNNLMHQVKIAIIRKLTFLHTFDFHWEIYKKCEKVKETTAQSYQKTLNLNNIKKSPGIEFVLCNCMGEIDHLVVWITFTLFLFIFKLRKKLMAYIHELPAERSSSSPLDPVHFLSS